MDNEVSRMRETGLARPVVAIGLMSGTSPDGIDAAVPCTDGGTLPESPC